MIETNSKIESEKSMLEAWHDNIYIYIYIHIYIYRLSTLAKEFTAATGIMQSSSNELNSLVFS